MRKNIINMLLKLPVVGDYVRCVKADTYPLTLMRFLRISVFKSYRHYYPMPKECIVQHIRKLYVGKNTHPFRVGCYYQAEGGIYIGNYVGMTNYCTLMSTNHDLYNHTEKHPKPIIIHDYCWIGTHSIILSGVELGPRTIVGAGSVVTKSFPEGFCVIAGNPAKIVKYLEKDKVVFRHYEYEYYGCLSPQQFKKYKKRFIDVSPEDFGIKDSKY